MFLPAYLHYPEDPETFGEEGEEQELEDVIMIGEDLLVAPVLNNDDLRVVYFPAG